MLRKFFVVLFLATALALLITDSAYAAGGKYDGGLGGKEVRCGERFYFTAIAQEIAMSKNNEFATCPSLNVETAFSGADILGLSWENQSGVLVVNVFGVTTNYRTGEMVNAQLIMRVTNPLLQGSLIWAFYNHSVDTVIWADVVDAYPSYNRNRIVDYVVITAGEPKGFSFHDHGLG